jgi:hypothetical protein
MGIPQGGQRQNTRAIVANTKKIVDYVSVLFRSVQCLRNKTDVLDTFITDLNLSVYAYVNIAHAKWSSNVLNLMVLTTRRAVQEVNTFTAE